jgi:phenylalanyl-tRNA synthetase beta chain
MKFTLSWLKDFLETDKDARIIADNLTSIGLEVEELIVPQISYEKFITAEILEAIPHPNASKLKLCTVATDNKHQQTLQIVCGASNARSGIKVILAQEGAIVPLNGMTIKNSEIRGSHSYGMLCSGEELLLPLLTPIDGIAELPQNVDLGVPIVDYYELDDPVFVINVTPNRGDALSVYGIARDLAAKGLGKLKKPQDFVINDHKILEDKALLE